MNSRDLVYDQVEAPYIKTDSTVARKKFRLRLSEKADFQIVSPLFRAVQALAMRIYMSFSVKKKMPGKRLLVATIAMQQLTSWLILPQDA